MVELIRESSWRRAWLRGAGYLREKKSDLNVILAIADPVSVDPHAAEFDQAVDAYLVSDEEHPLHTVAETIFPGWQYRRRGLRGLFDHYATQEFPALKENRPSSWGSYAHRLLVRTDAQGKTFNPLKNLIDKLITEKKVKGPKKACYEIGIAEGEYDAPLYNTVDDASRHMGGPCLSHLSFKFYDERLHLTALYRSHDYRAKALGNLLGLARLLACVSQETEIPVGTMTVHSTYAWFSTSKMGEFKTLLTKLEELIAQGEQLGMAI